MNNPTDRAEALAMELYAHFEDHPKACRDGGGELWDGIFYRIIEQALAQTRVEALEEAVGIIDQHYNTVFKTNASSYVEGRMDALDDLTQAIRNLIQICKRAADASKCRKNEVKR